MYVRGARVERNMMLYGAVGGPWAAQSRFIGVAQDPDYRVTLYDCPPDFPKDVQFASGASSSRAVVKHHGSGRGPSVVAAAGALSAPISKGIDAGDAKKGVLMKNC